MNSRVSPSPWPHPTIIPGDWLDLDLADSCALLAHLSAVEMASGVEASAIAVRYQRTRALRLKVFADWFLVEAEALFPGGEAGYCYFFYGPGRRLLPVHWQSELLLHLVSACHLDLNDLDKALEYLRLFVNLLASETGRFSVVESVADLRIVDGHALDASLNEPVVPLVLRPEQNPRSLITPCRMLFGGKLFSTQLRLFPDGLVILEGEEPLKAPLLCHEELRGMFRIFHSTPWPAPQPDARPAEDK